MGLVIFEAIIFKGYVFLGIHYRQNYITFFLNLLIFLILFLSNTLANN